MDKIIKMCKALGDESRMRLFRLLLHRSYCVKALAHQVQISPSAVSQHLKVLKEAHLVTGERRGYWVHYSVNPQGIDTFIQGITCLSQEKPLEEGGCCKKIELEREKPWEDQSTG